MTEYQRGVLAAQFDLAIRHYAKLYAEWEQFHRTSLRLGGHKSPESIDIHDVVLERMYRPAVVKSWTALVQPPACEFGGAQ